MSDIWSWPALAGVSAASLPQYLAVERAVWGKVHGARSDFRWIAASRGFAVCGRGLERELAVGIEDRPVRFPFWRAAPGLYVAGSGYPSRARDASGRGGALEKQILAWRAERSVPAAVAALLLLPRAAELDDGAWWGRAAPAAWDADLPFVLDLGGPLEVPVSERLLAEAAARGIAGLRARFGPDGGSAALAEVFGALLAGRRPVLCPLGDKPLEPEALAALLLPLDRERADGLSLAGWLPSSRPPRADLGGRWDVVVHAGSRSRTAEATAADPRARAMAAALLAADPSLLGGSPALDRPAARSTPAADEPQRRDAPELPPAEEPVAPGPPPLPRAPELAEPSAGAAAGWRILYDFARDPHRFWLDPQELAPYLREPAEDGQEAVRAALSWLRALAATRPPSGPAGDQHRAKEDLLRAGILALAPTENTIALLGAYQTDRVPPLLFLESAHPGRLNNARRRLSEERLAELTRQSRQHCAPELRARGRDRLDRW